MKNRKSRSTAPRAANIRPSGEHSALASAAALQQSGRLAEAERAGEAALASAPSSAPAHNFLGVLALQRRDLDRATRFLRGAVALEPNNPSFLVNFACAMAEQGQAEQAAQTLRRAIELEPSLVEAHNNLAAALNALGRSAEALDAAERALALRSDLPQALFARGNAQIALGQLDAGIASLRLAVERVPGNAQAHHNLGVALKRQKKYPEAADAFRRAVELVPGYVNAITSLATTLREMGKRDEAIAGFDRAAVLQPNSVAVHWNRCMAHLPAIYADEADVTRTRAAYQASLEELAKRFEGWTQSQLAQAAHVVGASTPFYLAYQGENDRALQAIYGTLACRLMAARFPQWSEPVPAVPLAPGEKIRVGFVSGFFSPNHSNWKLPLKGWIEQLDRRKFEVHGYHTRETRSEVTSALAASLDGFVLGPMPIQEWGARIRADRLHALIFAETGMDAVTTQLAALRLAPVQCTSWGHPMTSGLPTVDYFLSSERMEPSDGDGHYTERLVRLPNLSVYYEPPTLGSAEQARKELGLREGAVLYWCCQALYKYLPQHDDVFARIASAVPDAQFVFIQGETPALTAVFLARLKNAFERHGLEATGRYVVLPRLSGPDFAAATRNMDVFLDSIGWSGCNSTFESLACDLPVVTLAGKTMRSRHTAAIVSMMGMGDVVSGSVEDYVARAVSLGLDASERAQAAERIARAKHTIYRDSAAIAGLEAFLRKACARDE